MPATRRPATPAQARSRTASRRRAGLRDARRPARRAPRGMALRPPRSAWMHVPWWILNDVGAGRVSQLRSDAIGESLRTDAPEVPAENAYRSLPMGVVLWAPNPTMPSIVRTHMVVVETMRYERFVDATPEDIAAEGFADRTAWRRSWIEARKGKLFDPMGITEVFGIRHMRPGDVQAIGEAMARAMFAGYEHGENRDHHAPLA